MDRSLKPLDRGGSVGPLFCTQIAENSSNKVEHSDNNKADPLLQNSALFSQISLPLDPQPMISEAWESMRHSLVYFRGVPVGTIAALDSSDEKLNYDQVPHCSYLLIKFN